MVAGGEGRYARPCTVQDSAGIRKNFNCGESVAVPQDFAGFLVLGCLATSTGTFIVIIDIAAGGLNENAVRGDWTFSY